MDIFELIKDRAAFYEDQSIQIIKNFEPALNEAISRYLNESRSITWGAIELMLNNFKFVSVTGYIRVQPGDIVSIGDKRITVDEEFIKSNPVNIIKVVLPISILEKNSQDEIYEHIKIYNQLKQVMPIEELMTLADKLKAETLGDIIVSEKAMDEMTKPREFDGFNIENLTDIHQFQLRYFTETGSKIKH